MLDGQRVELASVFQLLAGVTIEQFNLLRIACAECGAEPQIDPHDELRWCKQCECRGYVCPDCRGDRFVVDRTQFANPKLMACPSCTTGDRYDFAREAQSVHAFLARNFVYGVTEDALAQYVNSERQRARTAEAGQAERHSDGRSAPQSTDSTLPEHIAPWLARELHSEQVTGEDASRFLGEQYNAPLSEQESEDEEDDIPF